jgi:hypothetical protein
MPSALRNMTRRSEYRSPFGSDGLPPPPVVVQGGRVPSSQVRGAALTWLTCAAAASRTVATAALKAFFSRYPDAFITCFLNVGSLAGIFFPGLPSSDDKTCFQQLNCVRSILAARCKNYRSSGLLISFRILVGTAVVDCVLAD